jgi:single stranded DNA-binding protein
MVIPSRYAKSFTLDLGARPAEDPRMSGLNQVHLIGHLGADPELRMTQNGHAMLKFRLATTEVYYDKDQKKQERTEWHRVTMWGKRAEGLSRILCKGTCAFVRGHLHTSSYEKDGQKHYSTEVIGEDLILCGGKMKTSSTSVDVAFPPKIHETNGGFMKPPLAQAVQDDIPF